MKIGESRAVKVGSLEYLQVLEGEDRLVLRFRLDPEKQSAEGLGWYIESAFRDAASAPARKEKARLEREGAGVDPIVLEKLKREFAKLLTRFDNRTLRAARDLANAVSRFSKEEEVILSQDCTSPELRGATGVVLARRKKYVLVDVGGKRWRVSPGLLTKKTDASDAGGAS